MSVLVQMRVEAPDLERFVATAKRFEPVFASLGAQNQAVCQAEGEPSEVTLFAEWESHHQMNAATDLHGDRFNEEAGTEGLEWETRVWHRR